MRTRLATVALGTLLLASQAAADVTLTTTSRGKGMMGRWMDGEGVSRIKGGKMRVDSTAGDRAMTTIIDLDAQSMTAVDHKSKEATVTDLREVQAVMQKITEGDLKVKLTPTGARRQVAGQTCEEHRVEMVVPFSLDPAMPLTVTTSGPFCVVPNAPGRADYAGFYLRAAEKGFIVAGDPRQAKAQPGQAKSMTELYRQMAKLGVPYAMDMEFKIGGEGPMAAMMSKMAGFGFTSTVTRVSTEPIEGDAFAVPAGYRIKRN
jgi:hypothetical protein